MKNKAIILYCVLSLGIILFTYFNLFFTFYQQDEWIAVGYAMENGIDFLLKYPLLNIIAGSGRILGTSISILFLKYFPFQIWPFALFSILLHFANTLLVFFIAHKVSKKSFIAALSGLFFAVSSVSDQAVIWAGAITNVLPASFFIFASLLLYLLYFEKKKKLLLFFSFLSAITAYYFRESAAFLFMLLPFLFFLLSREKRINVEKIKDMILLHFPLISFLVFVFIMRILSLQGKVFSGHFVTNNAFVKERLLSHLLLYPINALSQMFVHPGQMFSWASYFEKIYYPYVTIMVPSPAVYEFVVSDLLSFTFSLLILFIVFLLYKEFRQYRMTIIFATTFIVFSFIPYAILDKPSGYLESRYYYTSIMGTGILFAILGDALRSYLSKYSKLKKIASLVVVFLVIIYLHHQYTWIQKDITLQVALGNERKNFLVSVKRLLPHPNEKTILYFTGSQDFYTADNKVPFQLGPGYILMTWYYDTGRVPSRFIREEFLSHLFAQGYEEENGKGFGYYRDFEKLRQDTEKYQFHQTDIHAFYYDANEKELRNISEKVRADLNASRSAEFIR